MSDDVIKNAENDHENDQNDQKVYLGGNKSILLDWFKR